MGGFARQPFDLNSVAVHILNRECTRLRVRGLAPRPCPLRRPTGWMAVVKGQMAALALEGFVRSRSAKSCRTPSSSTSYLVG